MVTLTKNAINVLEINCTLDKFTRANYRRTLDPGSSQ